MVSQHNSDNKYIIFDLIWLSIFMHKSEALFDQKGKLVLGTVHKHL